MEYQDVALAALLKNNGKESLSVEITGVEGMPVYARAKMNDGIVDPNFPKQWEIDFPVRRSPLFLGCCPLADLPELEIRVGGIRKATLASASESADDLAVGEVCPLMAAVLPGNIVQIRFAVSKMSLNLLVGPIPTTHLHDVLSLKPGRAFHHRLCRLCSDLDSVNVYAVRIILDKKEVEDQSKEHMTTRMVNQLKKKSGGRISWRNLNEKAGVRYLARPLSVEQDDSNSNDEARPTKRKKFAF